MKTSTIVLIILIILLCLCLAIMGGMIGLLFSIKGDVFNKNTLTPSPVVVRPTTAAIPQPNATPQPEATFEITIIPKNPIEATAAENSLKVLENEPVPTSDLRDLAHRLKGEDDIPLTLAVTPVNRKTGEESAFWITNLDTDKSSQVTATLRYAGEHIYFWIENSVEYDEKELRKLAETFDQKIYQTDREFFGSEWTPGIDNDPHIYILLATNLGSTIAGYYSAFDSFSSQAHKYSNEHEMIFMNADNVSLSEKFTYGVLAHEFQHMIHGYHDRNEDTWLNEGFSELAAFLNGYGTGGFDQTYTSDPNIQLTYWPSSDKDSSPYYGAAFLFTNYFLGRFGEKATQALVGHPANGMVSVDTVLKDIGAVESITSKPLTADDVFLDWAVTNYTNNPKIGDGRYAYSKYPDAPKTHATGQIESCPAEMTTSSVHQYGVNYIQIDCSGKHTLHFEGSTQVKVLPADPHSGDYAFWSNRGDESDMTLTQEFDFTNANGSLTLGYWTWYDLEKNYDYAYILASTDNDHWQILKTPSGTDQDLSGNSYGWGYNQQSGDGPKWIEEKVDISQFAGKKVKLRFEYITDAAVNGEGVMLDDISIPEINYETDFESDDGGWIGEGFVRIENILPQSFHLALISVDNEKTKVENISLSDDNSADIGLDVGGTYKYNILVITGTTRFTNQTAAYRYNVK
ncbi:MAG: hypothetical protein WCI88_13635 [Chloroflexota bacterium]